MGVRLLGRGDDLLAGRIRLAVGDILRNRTGLQPGLLQHHAQVAEDGGNISQGQRQLLCIARVMLRRPPILILDEATSSIDTRTEVLVQDAFEELMKGRTSFIVAHRLSTIKNADQILVMKAGNIIERGTHEELLAQGGFYKQLYESQFAKA